MVELLSSARSPRGDQRTMPRSEPFSVERQCAAATRRARRRRAGRRRRTSARRRGAGRCRRTRPRAGASTSGSAGSLLGAVVVVGAGVLVGSSPGAISGASVVDGAAERGERRPRRAAASAGDGDDPPGPPRHAADVGTASRRGRATSPPTGGPAEPVLGAVRSGSIPLRRSGKTCAQHEPTRDVHSWSRSPRGGEPLAWVPMSETGGSLRRCCAR